MIQAITLSGGGAYGAFEVGVLKALMGGHAPVTDGELLDPKIYTGTSAGAFNAAILLSSEAEDPKGRIDFLERIWLEQVCDSPHRDGNGVYHIRGDVRRYLEPAWLARNPAGPFQQAIQDAGFFASDMLKRATAFAASREPLERRTLELFDLSSLISTDPFHELIKRTVVIERIRRISPDVLQVEMTIEDPKAYTKPWTVTLKQRIVVDTDLIDEICLENEKFLEHLK